MKVVAEWMNLSDESLDATERLLDAGLWRSAISRAWYSVAASIHATVISLGESPPDHGNWSNAKLSALLVETLRSKVAAEPAYFRLVLRKQVQDLWAWRLAADYGPAVELGKREAEQAYRSAVRMAAMARRQVR